MKLNEENQKKMNQVVQTLLENFTMEELSEIELQLENYLGLFKK